MAAVSGFAHFDVVLRVGSLSYAAVISTTPPSTISVLGQVVQRFARKHRNTFTYTKYEYLTVCTRSGPVIIRTPATDSNHKQ